MDFSFVRFNASTLKSIFLLLLLSSCHNFSNTSSDDSIPLADKTFSKKESSLSNTTITLDSSQFRISRLFYTSGKLFSYTAVDTIKNLRYEKKYLPNGNPENEGMWDDNQQSHVGLWKYYLSAGTVKEINFDSTQQVSSYQALQKAKAYGWTKHRLEINEELVDQVIYWKVIQWTKEQTAYGSGEFILIRRSTGEITKPADNSIEYFE